MDAKEAQSSGCNLTSAKMTPLQHRPQAKQRLASAGPFLSLRLLNGSQCTAKLKVGQSYAD